MVLDRLRAELGHTRRVHRGISRWSELLLRVHQGRDAGRQGGHRGAARRAAVDARPAPRGVRTRPLDQQAARPDRPARPGRRVEDPIRPPVPGSRAMNKLPTADEMLANADAELSNAYRALGDAADWLRS